MSPQDEKDIADVEVDEVIFEDANAAEIQMFQINVNGELHDAIAGNTYPWKSVVKGQGALKAAGFSFSPNVPGLNLWLCIASESQTWPKPFFVGLMARRERPRGRFRLCER